MVEFIRKYIFICYIFSSSILSFGLVLKSSMVYRRLLRATFSLSQWYCADVVPTPKGFTPVSITRVLSKDYECLVSSRFYPYIETEGVFPRQQYAYCQGLGTCHAILDIFCAGQAAFDTGRVLAVV